MSASGPSGPLVFLISVYNEPFYIQGGLNSEECTLLDSEYHKSRGAQWLIW